MSDEVRKYYRDWYHKQDPLWKAKKQQQTKKRKQAIAALVNEYKTSRGCSKCKENVAIALDIHHLDDKEIEISNAVRYGWGWERILAEMKKCTILCANCHRKYHAGLLEL